MPGKDGDPGSLLYTFKQAVPIPSYLFALASGFVLSHILIFSPLSFNEMRMTRHSDIATASIGPRSLVATGPEEIGDAKWELEEDTERFIQVAEVEMPTLLTSGVTNDRCLTQKILQTVPYAWTSYNVLVLPPSFPYGGTNTARPHCHLI